MFQNRSAWFSTSVTQERHNYWMSEGGAIASWRTADYLFSDNATCPDTLRIFESKDYLWNKVTVFHSLYLSACERRHSVKSVCIGHYVLPPASVQDEVRNVVGRLIWEREGDQSVAQVRYVSIDNLQKYSGELYDFRPGHFGYSVCKAKVCDCTNDGI
ncbi:telomere repeats-binding bouquet formation protein 2 [Polymixia lowei]